MQIQCKIERDGGSLIDLGGHTYHFQPQADGAHVAEIEDDAHIARLLAIPEGYKIYKAGKAEATQPSEPSVPAKLAGDVDGDGDVDDADQRAALALQYEQKFGKKPHYALGIAKLRKALGE